MPYRNDYTSGRPVPKSGKTVPTPARPASAEPDETDGVGFGTGAAALAAGAGALALTRNPALARRIGRGAMDLRMTSMLSGLAPLKSALGNLGGTAMVSLEQRSMRPLKELLSMETARDVGRTFRRGPNPAYGPTSDVSQLNLPARVMSTLDEASQRALVRAGLTPEAATAEMLQTPVPQRLAEGLENPVMKFLVPFRRTPINQLVEGGKSIRADLPTAVSFGTGVAEGATAEDPRTLALGSAAMGKRSLTASLGQGVGRYMTGGRVSEATRGLAPISDYGFESGVEGALKAVGGDIVPKPAAIGAIDYFRRLLGLK